MTKKEMMNTIIRELGFENEYTIEFCRLVESGVRKSLLADTLKVFLVMGR